MILRFVITRSIQYCSFHKRVLDDDVWTAIGKKDEKEENRRITCGSTIINDKFIVFAAHCETDFKPSR